MFWQHHIAIRGLVRGVNRTLPFDNIQCSFEVQHIVTRFAFFTANIPARSGNFLGNIIDQRIEGSVNVKRFTLTSFTATGGNNLMPVIQGISLQGLNNHFLTIHFARNSKQSLLLGSYNEGIGNFFDFRQTLRQIRFVTMTRTGTEIIARIHGIDLCLVRYINRLQI